MLLGGSLTRLSGRESLAGAFPNVPLGEQCASVEDCPFRGLRQPVGFLDFETVARAIPVWHGVAPWGAVPVQFSYHEACGDGSYGHSEWLASGPRDPREDIAGALVTACRRAGSIVCYTSFESQQIRHLMDAVPRLSGELETVERRLFDLQRVVKDNVYHPDFSGSFSIKEVLPVMVPGLSYEGLAVADGLTASTEIVRLMLHAESMTEEERASLRRDLLAYCERDTWAMVKLNEELRRLADE
jgi:hypothetical protein